MLAVVKLRMLRLEQFNGSEAVMHERCRKLQNFSIERTVDARAVRAKIVNGENDLGLGGCLLKMPHQVAFPPSVGVQPPPSDERLGPLEVHGPIVRTTAQVSDAEARRPTSPSVSPNKFEDVRISAETLLNHKD